MPWQWALVLPRRWLAEHPVEVGDRVHLAAETLQVLNATAALESL